MIRLYLSDSPDLTPGLGLTLPPEQGRYLSAVMRKQEGGGSLVAFASGVGMWGSVSQANYAAAKGGIVALMRSAAVG